MVRVTVARRVKEKKKKSREIKSLREETPATETVCKVTDRNVAKPFQKLRLVTHARRRALPFELFSRDFEIVLRGTSLRPC